jgi:DNA-binding response OmpR family regulator
MSRKVISLKKRILVADGDEVARMLIEKVLKHGGYEISAVSDGLQAIEALAQKKYDLLIFDKEYLKMDWPELVRKALVMRKKISVIILTANGTLDSAIQAIRFHVSDYLLKPIVPRDILDSVRNALRDQESIEIPQIPFKQRTSSKLKKPVTVEIDEGLFFDRERRRVYNQSATIMLTNTENKIFASLVDLNEQVTQPDEIVALALGYSVNNDDAAKMLRPVMCRVRNKLVRLGLPRTKIQNVRGSGYLLERIPHKS